MDHLFDMLHLPVRYLDNFCMARNSGHALDHNNMRNCGLNAKLCAKRKLSHSDVNTCVFFVKKETSKFVIERRN